LPAAAVVTALSLTPVKGTRVHTVDSVLLEPGGVRENRRFYIIDGRDRLANGKRLGALTTIVSEYADAERRLTLRFPDGREVTGTIARGEEVRTRYFSRSARGRIVRGSFSAALTEYLGEPLRLVEAVEPGGAVDRGARGVASLISRASLERLAVAGDAGGIDARRFRMLIEIDGVDAHAEDRWVGQTVDVGEAQLALHGHVGRCLITSRHPDTGEVDLPTLEILSGYRGAEAATEPLPFGVYGEVLRAGRVRVGDGVRLSERVH
jgi:uncharacterized protein